MASTSPTRALYFDDAQSDGPLELEKLNFSVRGIEADKHFPISLQFDFKGPEIVASVDAGFDARLDVANNAYELLQGEVEVTTPRRCDPRR